MDESQQKTILIADDEPGQRALLEMVLSAEGYRVTAVEDGRQVLDYLKEQTPDLMILDVKMPVLSGIDVCDRVKRIKRLQHIPIIILTALKDERIQTEARLAKADAVVLKPLSGKDFRLKVKSLLSGATTE